MSLDYQLNVIMGSSLGGKYKFIRFTIYLLFFSVEELNLVT